MISSLGPFDPCPNGSSAALHVPRGCPPSEGCSLDEDHCHLRRCRRLESHVVRLGQHPRGAAQRSPSRCQLQPGSLTCPLPAFCRSSCCGTLTSPFPQRDGGTSGPGRATSWCSCLPVHTQLLGDHSGHAEPPRLPGFILGRATLPYLLTSFFHFTITCTPGFKGFFVSWATRILRSLCP